MTEIRTEPEGRKKNRNNNWWVWAVVAILALLVAWIALSERSDVGEVEPEATTAVSLEQIIINRTTAFV